MYLLSTTDDRDEVTQRAIAKACAEYVVGDFGLPLAVLRDVPRLQAMRHKPERQVGHGPGWVLYQDDPIEGTEPKAADVVSRLSRWSYDENLMNRRVFVQSVAVAPLAMYVPTVPRANRLIRLVESAPYSLVCVHPRHSKTVASAHRQVTLTRLVPERAVWSCERIDPDDYALRAMRSAWTRSATSPGSVAVDWERVSQWGARPPR